jgi:chemotaxis protein CheD
MGKHVNITQGEHAVSADPDTTIGTLLGSCVACCLWDPIAGVGGMNHILLATTSRNNANCDMAGVNAMELLINDMLKLGASRNRLMAKTFGGAQMINGLSDIGPANCAFATNFLEIENIQCVSSSLGGSAARQLVFTPATGAARVKTQRASIPEPVIQVAEVKGNDLELF